VIAALLLLAAVHGVHQGAPPRAALQPYAAVVDARHAGADGDTVAGAPTYRSLGAALGGLPANGAGRAVIFIRNGRYREKLTIDRPRVTLLGESRDGTVLTFDAAAGVPAPHGGTWGTRGSYTLRVIAPDFRAERLTIENAFDYPANAAKPDGDPTKLRDAQAVALMLDHGSDRAAFVDVRILGHQDTLSPTRAQLLPRVEVAGERRLHLRGGAGVVRRLRHRLARPGQPANNGYVTAPSTPIVQPYGSCSCAAASRRSARGWRPTRSRSAAPGTPSRPECGRQRVFVDCWMDDHIGAKGWDRMSMVDSTGTRVWWEPESARFFELGTTGPAPCPAPAGAC
jgi:pectinesterase